MSKRNEVRRIERAASKEVSKFSEQTGISLSDDIHGELTLWFRDFAIRERKRALREAAEVAQEEMVSNKGAALRARCSGRLLVSDFRDSDGNCAGRIETKIRALTKEKKRG